MAALCDWYDCDDVWKYDTIARDVEVIQGVWVNMIGATTPDLIQSSLPIESIGGGLTSRIIFVFEEKRGKIVPQPVKTEREAILYQNLVFDLEKIALMSGSFRWTEGFASAWTDFCYYAAKNPPFYDSKFDGYLGRRRTHLMKLSMIMSASKPDHPMILTRDDFDEAMELLIEAEEKMPLVFRGVGKSDISSLLHRSIVYLKNVPYKEVPIFRFVRHFQDDMDDFSVTRVLGTLEAMKMIKRVHIPGGDDKIVILDETVQNSNDLIPECSAEQPSALLPEPSQLPPRSSQ